MLQRLAHYDPYTIQQVEFFVQKKNKYTTLKSILISIAILALTLVLNISLVQQLWIPRSQLSVTSSERKISEQQFSQAYFCVIAKNTSTQLPNSTLYTYSQSLGRTQKIVPSTSIFNQNSQILKITQQRRFECYNMEGVVINSDVYMKINIYGSADKFDLLFQYFTSNEIMGKTSEQNFIYFETGNIPSDNQYIYTFKKIHGVIYDSLMVDYQPQVIYGFSPIHYRLEGSSVQGYSSVTFRSETVKPYDTTTSYTLRRVNIGEILGKLLSWFSIFALMAAFAIRPILEYNYKVQLCKKLYDNQKLTRINISVLSYIKYLISFLRGDIFDEAILYTAFQQLQKDLDLLNLIKKQTMMKKLIKENQFVSKQINGNLGTSILEHNEDDEKQTQELFIGKFLNNELQSSQLEEGSQSNEGKLPNKQAKQSLKAPLITERDPQTQQSCLVTLMKSLDCSETNISLISNKGEGYKTSWNTILTAICLAGVLWFIIFAGIFQMEPNYSISAIALDYDESVIANVTINPEDILFRSIITDPLDDYFVNAIILDQNDNMVENLTLLSGAACQEYKSNLNQTGNDWRCLSKPIHIYNDGRGNINKLGLHIIFNGFSFTSPDIEILFWQYNIVNNDLVKTKMYSSYTFSSNQLVKHDGQAIMFVNDQEMAVPENIITTPELNPNKLFWTSNKPSVSTESIFKGVSFQVESEMIKVTKQIPTIWQVIDTAWGIVVLAFSVFLSKITRYLNVKEREKITRNEQNQTRNDIVSIVSTQYKLIYRVFGNQLQRVKYFYKTNLEDFGAKIR